MVKYFFLLNGSELGPITPKRGLQGNPLSSYLFILLAEGLFALFRYAKKTL